MAPQNEMGKMCSDGTDVTLKSCFDMTPQIEVEPMCSDVTDSTYPTLLSSPRHAHGASAENLETQTRSRMEAQKIDEGEEFLRMIALIKAVKITMTQPGAAPKRYVQRKNVGQRAMGRTVNMGSLIEAVQMTMQKPGTAPKYIESDKGKRSQRMTGLIKDVKMAMSQPGAAPKRYVQRAKKGQVAMDRTLSVSFLIDAVRMAMQKVVPTPK